MFHQLHPDIIRQIVPLAVEIQPVSANISKHYLSYTFHDEASFRRAVQECYSELELDDRIEILDHIFNSVIELYPISEYCYLRLTMGKQTLLIFGNSCLNLHDQELKLDLFKLKLLSSTYRK